MSEITDKLKLAARGDEQAASDAIGLFDPVLLDKARSVARWFRKHRDFDEVRTDHIANECARRMVQRPAAVLGTRTPTTKDLERYAYRVLTNIAKDIARKHRADARKLRGMIEGGLARNSESNCPSEALENEERFLKAEEILLAAAEQDESGHAIWLAKVNGASTKELAHTLGCSSRAIQRRYARFDALVKAMGSTYA